MGLGERDQDSVSEDGGRTVSVGTGMGLARGIPRGPTGEDIVIFRPFQGFRFSLKQVKDTTSTCRFFRAEADPYLAYSSHVST